MAAESDADILETAYDRSDIFFEHQVLAHVLAVDHPPSQCSVGRATGHLRTKALIAWSPAGFDPAIDATSGAAVIFFYDVTFDVGRLEHLVNPTFQRLITGQPAAERYPILVPDFLLRIAEHQLGMFLHHFRHRLSVDDDLM